MSEDSDLEKTEPASQKKLDEAREQGNVPRSKELTTCAVLLGAGLIFMVLGDRMIAQLGTLISRSLVMEREQAYDMNLLVARAASLILDVLIAFAPLAGTLILVTLAAPMLIGGWNFSTSAFMPKFSKLNPLKGLSNMVSKNSMVELIKALAKTGLVGVVAWMVMKSELDAVMALIMQPVNLGSAHAANLILNSFMLIVSGLVLIAAIDVPYQLWHHANELKMTREELKKEAKESEGNPEIKAKIRQTQREMARRRMMSNVPTADVVVTNPTHYAVALKYTDGKMRAPKVVAKGADEVAAKIRELAAASGVPLLEAPPLARALFTHAEIDDEIPETLYTAVAEVLAYVFQLKAHIPGKTVRPEPPTDLIVPPELDPNNTAT